MKSLRNIAYLIDFHYISVAKQLNIENLSMNKDRHIISELNSFFAESNNTKAIQGIMNVMSHITLDQRQIEFAKAANCKFTAGQVLELMVLFPFFPVKNGHNFAKSILDTIKNRSFEKSLAARIKLPYTKWWYEQDTDKFLKPEGAR